MGLLRFLGVICVFWESSASACHMRTRYSSQEFFAAAQMQDAIELADAPAGPEAESKAET